MGRVVRAAVGVTEARESIMGDASEVRDAGGGAAGERFVFAARVLANDQASVAVMFMPAAAVNPISAALAVVEPP